MCCSIVYNIVHRVAHDIALQTPQNGSAKQHTHTVTCVDTCINDMCIDDRGSDVDFTVKQGLRVACGHVQTHAVGTTKAPWHVPS